MAPVLIPPTAGDGDADPPAPLVTSWRVRAEAGEPQATVRVRNLQGAFAVGRDAWGRAGRLQPVLLSAEVSFAQSFSSPSSASASADTDELDAGTAHYGTLSKTLLGALELWRRGADDPPGDGAAAAAPRTADVLELLWARVTGRAVDGSRVALPPDQLPFLDAARLRALSLTVTLPKASLLGAGVSLTAAASYRHGDGRGAEGGADAARGVHGNPLGAYARTLRIAGLRVPTLVGVNPNERGAKQLLVADVEIDRFDAVDDVHSELERLVVETMESSSFRTLEALASRVAERILSDFRVASPSTTATTAAAASNSVEPLSARQRGWQVRVALEKPVAVPFAECPVVEVTMGP
ncbi:Dihydroneopterin aldolase-domain-containing protein [Durotheca rogersii]|uniref:Dihydroneopterin aldolase-domain-containing protein n=1 Tax=Durotheca rogersii TaxID=419775 RepID=UPI00221FBD9E|nr:Dihydroneopterin aldolase-domain-containing protein [Durotheca rogersii]KAI5861756.1 Dihydroneopterin aldolase-domain-containing protein [Durotheca rogersii]